MSTTRKRAIVLGAIVLVCGIAAILLTSRQSREFTISFQGFETNGAGVVSADLMLTNFSRLIWHVFAGSKGPNTVWTGPVVRVAPHAGRGYKVVLPTQRPCRIIAQGDSMYPDTLSGRARSDFEMYWRRCLGMPRPDPTFTFDIPE